MTEYGYVQDKDGLINRLHRIEGQVRGISRMVAEDKYCIDILTQISAATKALQSVAIGLLNEHLARYTFAAQSASRSRQPIRPVPANIPVTASALPLAAAAKTPPMNTETTTISMTHKMIRPIQKCSRRVRPLKLRNRFLKSIVFPPRNPSREVS